MKVFILPREFTGQTTFSLQGRNHRYIARVLRMRPGTTFPGRDAQGAYWDLTVSAVERDRTILSCIPAAPLHREESRSDSTAAESILPSELQRTTLPGIWLYQSIGKGKKMDQIIRQSTEIGVSRIIPVMSDYTIPLPGDDRTESRIDRWRTIIREAQQQSGSRVMTEIQEPIPAREIPAHWAGRGSGILFHHVPSSGPPYTEVMNAASIPIAVAIGPEGGFSEEEAEFLKGNGFATVHLNTNILRAETAAVYALATAQTLLTERVITLQGELSQ